MPKLTKEDKFKALYAEWVQPLFRFVYFKCRDQAQAEDIVQETFVKYWDKMDTVKEGCEKSYLYTTAKNQMLNMIAHDKVVHQHAQSLSHGKVDSPEYEMEVTEFKEKLEKAIASLPENQKEVFLMNRIDGMKYREIAEALGLSQKAVEKRMSLALIQLRKIHNKI